MKKYLIVIILILISVVGFAQKRGSLYTVPDRTTVFGVSLTPGTLLFQKDSGLLYSLDSVAWSTDNIASSYVSLVTSGSGGSLDTLRISRTYYVSDSILDTLASDLNEGSISYPFASIVKAVAAVNALSPTEDAQVVIKITSGSYNEANSTGIQIPNFCHIMGIGGISDVRVTGQTKTAPLFRSSPLYGLGSISNLTIENMNGIGGVGMQWDAGINNFGQDLLFDSCTYGIKLTNGATVSFKGIVVNACDTGIYVEDSSFIAGSVLQMLYGAYHIYATGKTSGTEISSISFTGASVASMYSEDSANIKAYIGYTDLCLDAVKFGSDPGYVELADIELKNSIQYDINFASNAGYFISKDASYNCSKVNGTATDDNGQFYCTLHKRIHFLSPIQGSVGTNSITEFSTDGTFSGNSDDAAPTEKAAKHYVDSTTAGVYIEGTVIDTIQADTIIVHKLLRPDTDLGADIGSPSLRFDTLYMGGGIVITDNSGNDSIVVYDDGDSARINTDNPLSINNTVVANAFSGDGSSLINLPVVSDSSRRVIVKEQGQLDTVLYGANALDIATSYIRYNTDTTYHLIAYGTFNCDSNIALARCTYEFHNVEITKTVASDLFNFPTNTEYVKILGDWDATCSRSVIDITNIGNFNYADFYVECDTLVTTGAYSCIDAYDNLLRLNSFVLKGNLAYSLGGIGINTYFSQVVDNYLIECNSKSDASYSLQLYEIPTFPNSCKINCDYAIGLTTGFYTYSVASGDYLEANIGYCNNPTLSVSGGTGQNGVIDFTGYANQMTINLNGAGTINTYGKIYYIININGTATTTYLRSHANIYSNVYLPVINFSNHYIYTDFYGDMYLNSSSLGTQYDNNYVGFHGNQYNISGIADYIITAGHYTFYESCNFYGYSTGSSHDLSYYIQCDGGETYVGGYFEWQGSNYTGGCIYVNGGILKTLPTLRIKNRQNWSNESLLTIPYGIGLTDGYIEYNGGSIYNTSDTGSCVVYWNSANDTVYHKGDYYTNQEWVCATGDRGTTNLFSGHDWSGANKDSFAITVNGAVIDTIELNVNCANIAAVVSHINTQFAAEGVTGITVLTYEVTPGNENIYFVDKVAGDTATFTLSAGGGTALTTLGLNAATYSSFPPYRAISNGGIEIKNSAYKED